MTTAGSSVSVSSATSTTTYYVKACNGAGKCSSNASYAVKLDKTKPTVSYSVAGGTYTSTKTVTITASDTNFSSMSVETYKDGTLQSGKSVSGRTSNTYSVALDSAGSWTIYTKVHDAAGQIQSTTPQNSNSFYYQSYTINLSYAATKTTTTYAATENTADACSCSCSSWEGDGHCRWHESVGDTVEWFEFVDSYSCNDGDTLSGTTCTHTAYTCPNGGTLSGTTCYF